MIIGSIGKMAKAKSAKCRECDGDYEYVKKSKGLLMEYRVK